MEESQPHGPHDGTAVPDERPCESDALSQPVQPHGQQICYESKRNVHCGSGKRFKHCCGQIGEASQLRFEALAAHRAGSYGRAESLYRRALEENPGDTDVLHMLGVVQLSRMRYREALDLLWDAAERTQWAVPPIRHNLGLVLAKLLAPSANRRLAELMAEFLAWERSHSLVREDTPPLVTVVLPAYNDARHIVQAITSVTGQTYPNIELVVIDDGSTDDTAKIVAECITRVSQPVRFHSRDNRGAPATLNEGAALAQGRYLAFLNARDHYASDRIACLVERIARGVSAGAFRWSPASTRGRRITEWKRPTWPNPISMLSARGCLGAPQFRAIRIQHCSLDRQSVRRA